MRRARILLLVTLIWFFLVYNLGHLQSSFDFGPFTTFYLSFCFFLLFLIPIRRKNQIYVTILSMMLFNFIIKFLSGFGLRSLNLTSSMLDAIAIAFTGYLGIKLSSLAQELSDLPNNYQSSVGTPNFEVAQSQIYTEIRRARRYQRSASLLAVSSGKKLNEVSNRMSIQRKNGHFVSDDITSRLAKLFVRELRDYDLIALRDDRFIILLPETDRENACETTRRLKAIANEQLGIELEIGLATFPDEAVTFERLLEIAEGKIDQAFAVFTDRDEAPASISGESLLNYD